MPSVVYDMCYIILSAIMQSVVSQNVMALLLCLHDIRIELFRGILVHFQINSVLGHQVVHLSQIL
jgi:hypothetical protein